MFSNYTTFLKMIKEYKTFIKMSNKKKNINIDEYNELISDVIIKKCYLIDTEKYLIDIESINNKILTEKDRKFIDAILSCISVGISINYLRKKNDKILSNISEIILKKIYTAIVSNKKIDFSSSVESANFEIELIKFYSKTLDDEEDSLLSFSEIALCPAKHLFENIEYSPGLDLLLAQFMAQCSEQVKNIIDFINKEYNLTI